MQDQTSNNWQLMQKITEIIPQLRAEILNEQTHKFQNQFSNQIQGLQRSIKQKYQKMLNEQVQGINSKIKQNLSSFANSLKIIRQTNVPKRQLTSKEQEELIQSTVQQILSDQALKKQIKQKLSPKMQQKVRILLIRDIQQNIQKYKEETKLKIQRQRNNWRAQRQFYWKSESQRQVEELAAQYQQQQQKKSTIEKSLKDKIAGKAKNQKKYETLLQHSRQIANIKKQIKELQLRLR